MEYDLETFLDEYQPLFKSEHHAQSHMTRFEQLKKRYFSDSTIVGSGLSKMKSKIVFRKKNNVNNNLTTEKESDDNDRKLNVCETDDFQHNDVVTDEGVNEEDIKDYSSLPVPVISFESETMDDTCDEDVSLIVPSKNSDKRSFGKNNKAALFVRNSAKRFRKKNTTKTTEEICDNTIETEKDEQLVFNNGEISMISKNTAPTTTATAVKTSNSTTNKSNLRIKDLRWKQSRYLWKNARKRMNYVVGFVRKKDDDEVMLIEESERYEFTNFKLRAKVRRHSFSSVYETSSNNENLDNTLNVPNDMNAKYLSPQGTRAESRLSSSSRNSRRSSLDSNIGPISSFISQEYLKKSQSSYSLSSVVGTNEEEVSYKKDSGFEECFFHPDTFQRDGALECVGNKLYDSMEEEERQKEPGTEDNAKTAELSGYGEKEFHISENDIADIVNEEVNCYLDASSPRSPDSNRDRNNNNNNNNSQRYVKESHAFSYSVNDLYELFADHEKASSPTRLKNIEVSFDDLVV